MAAVVYVLSSRIIKPIGATTKQLELIAEGRIDQVEILDAKGNDEIGSMARALNSLNSKFIAITSFSKSIGLSGQRIGFVHSTNDDFLKEFVSPLLEQNAGEFGGQGMKQHTIF